MLEKLLSGAQTGADRAALDWAIFRDIPHGGLPGRAKKRNETLMRSPQKYLLLSLVFTVTVPLPTRASDPLSSPAVMQAKQKTYTCNHCGVVSTKRDISAKCPANRDGKGHHWWVEMK